MSALSTEDITVSNPTFASLGVPASLVAVLAKSGITVPFPIQAATLPDALAGRDILGRAQTGSGKTLGFSLPLVARLADGHTMACRPRGLILVPTRELAAQVHGVLTPLAHAAGLKVATIFGGTSQNPQVAALRNRADIVVACPGRLADLIEQGHCHLGDVEITVLDEADHMADLGFLPVVRRLLDATPADGQRMLFSATLDGAVDVIARRFLHRPARHSVDADSKPPEITHHLLTVTPADRVGVIATLASGEGRVLIFTRTKHGARKLVRQLALAGTLATELHGNLTQGARTRNLAAFASGEVRALVATDIAARGIHVDGIDLVVHADPPTEHKAYTHRSGRTARGRHRGHRGHRADRGPGGRGPHPDAQGRRQPADVPGRPGFRRAARDRRPPGQARAAGRSPGPHPDGLGVRVQRRSAAQPRRRRRVGVLPRSPRSSLIATGRR